MGEIKHHREVYKSPFLLQKAVDYYEFWSLSKYNCEIRFVLLLLRRNGLEALGASWLKLRSGWSWSSH